MPTETPTATPLVTLTRILNAPRERVFAAWTQPDLLCKWFGPTMDSECEAEIDLRIGGDYAVHINGFNGTRRTVHGKYLEIAPPARLVMTWHLSGFAEADGSVITVDLRERDGKTEITVIHAQLPNEQMREAHTHGWNAGLNKLVLLFDPTAKIDITSPTTCRTGD